MLDTFPKISETFVRDEILWMQAHGYLAQVVAVDVDDTLLKEIPDALRSRVRAAPFRYIGRAERARLAVYWLTRAPRRFIATYRALGDDIATMKYFWNAAAIARACFAKRCHVIHVHFAGFAAELARFVSLLTGIPFTVTTHHYDLVLLPPSNYKQLARDAALVLTISEYNRRYLIDTFGVPADKIRVLHCGVDVEHFRSTVGPDRQRPPRIVSIGRLVAIKGFDYLIAACAQISRSGTAFSLTIIGGGELREPLTERIRALGLAEQVVITGAQSSDWIRAELATADVFVMASLSEGIPVVLMEAMAMELPVIATRVRGVPELVEDRVTGLLVEACDSDALAAAVRELIADPMLCQRLAGAGRDKVIAEFNAEIQYQTLLDTWQGEIIGRLGTRAPRARAGVSY